MMNGVSFTGREGMLTKGIKNVAAPDKIHEYLGTGKIYKKAAQVVPDIRPQLAELENIKDKDALDKKLMEFNIQNRNYDVE